MIAVAFDGASGDADGGRDFLADFSGGEELDDFQFARGERAAGDGMLGAIAIVALIVDESFHHGHGETPGEEWLVLLDVADGGDQFGIGVGFQNVTARAATEDFAGDVFGKVHGEDEDFRFGRFFANNAGHFKTIHFGHGEVEKDEIGFGFFDVLDGFDAGGGFATNLQARLGFKEGANTTAHNGVIIRYENAIRLGRCRFSGHVDPLGRQR